MGKSRIGFTKESKKKKKYRRDEENILSKDIDVEEEMKFLEKMTEKSGVQREMSNVNYSKSFVKNLKFKPHKYKGNYLPYHLRWIFGNSVKNNEISLVQEIKALETEIVRLKQQKVLNREFRRIAGLNVNYQSASKSLCPCCKKYEQKNHCCSHTFCEVNCVRKKAEAQFANTFSSRTNRITKGLYNELKRDDLFKGRDRKALFMTKVEIKETEDDASKPTNQSIADLSATPGKEVNEMIARPTFSGSAFTSTTINLSTINK